MFLVRLLGLVSLVAGSQYTLIGGFERLEQIGNKVIKDIQIESSVLYESVRSGFSNPVSSKETHRFLDKVSKIKARSEMVKVHLDRKLEARDVVGGDSICKNCLPFFYAIDSFVRLAQELTESLQLAGCRDVDRIEVILSQMAEFRKRLNSAREFLRGVGMEKEFATAFKAILGYTRDVYTRTANSIDENFPVLKEAGVPAKVFSHLEGLTEAVVSLIESAPYSLTPAAERDYLSRESSLAQQMATALQAFVDLPLVVSVGDKLINPNTFRELPAGWIGLSSMIDPRLNELAPTTTTTTTRPVALSIDELIALVEPSKEQGPKKNKKDKKGNQKNGPRTSTTQEPSTSTTTTTTQPETFDMEEDEMNRAEWEPVDHSKTKSKAQQSVGGTQKRKTIAKPKHTTVSITNFSKTTTTTKTTTVPITTTPKSTTTETTTVTIPTTPKPTTTETTTVTTTCDPTTTSEAPTSTTSQGNPVASSDEKRKSRDTGSIRPNRRTSQSAIQRNPVVTPPSMAYLGIPLPGPTIDQVWMMANQLSEISQQIDQLNMLALQQSMDPAVSANIEYFAHQTAITRRSIADLKAAADNLVAFMKAFQSIVFVPVTPRNSVL